MGDGGAAPAACPLNCCPSVGVGVAGGEHLRARLVGGNKHSEHTFCHHQLLTQVPAHHLLR